ncbi:cupin domain-containing protein [Bacillus sp. AK128]
MHQPPFYQYQWYNPIQSNWNMNPYIHANWNHHNSLDPYNWVNYVNQSPWANHQLGTYSRNNNIKDYGKRPFVINMEEVTKKNKNFRTALWTGKHLQLTLMSINSGEDIGLEIHPNLDQFIRIEEGRGVTLMGDSKNQLDFERKVYEDDAIFIPAGKWHNLINTGSKPLKLYSIYAPAEHPFGTVHETKAAAMAAERNYRFY